MEIPQTILEYLENETGICAEKKFFKRKISLKKQFPELSKNILWHKLYKVYNNKDDYTKYLDIIYKIANENPNYFRIKNKNNYNFFIATHQMSQVEDEGKAGKIPKSIIMPAKQKEPIPKIPGEPKFKSPKMEIWL